MLFASERNFHIPISDLLKLVPFIIFCCPALLIIVMTDIPNQDQHNSKCAKSTLPQKKKSSKVELTEYRNKAGKRRSHELNSLPGASERSNRHIFCFLRRAGVSARCRQGPRQSFSCWMTLQLSMISRRTNHIDLVFSAC